MTPPVTPSPAPPDANARIVELEARLAEALRFLGHDAREGHSSTLALLELQRIKSEPMTLPQFAERVEANARKSLAAIDDFADLARARGQALQPEAVDLLDLLVEVVADAWPVASQRGVRIQIGEHPDVVMGRADPEWLRIALTKLLRDLVARARTGTDIGCLLRADASAVTFEFATAGTAGDDAPPSELRRAARLSSGLLLAQTVAERHGGGMLTDRETPGRLVIRLSLPGRAAQ